MLFSASGAEDEAPGPIAVINSPVHGLSAVGDLENQERYVVEVLDESDPDEETTITRPWICYVVAALVVGRLLVAAILDAPRLLLLLLLLDLPFTIMALREEEESHERTHIIIEEPSTWDLPSSCLDAKKTIHHGHKNPIIIIDCIDCTNCIDRNMAPNKVVPSMSFSASRADDAVPGPIAVKNSSARGLSAVGDLENQKHHVVELLDESDAEEEARMIRLGIC